MKKRSDILSERFRFKERKMRWSLTIVFSLIVFFVLLCAIALAALAVYILIRVGVIGGLTEEINLALVVLIMSAISIVIGSVSAFFLSRIPLKPINDLINKMNRLAAGDFKVRLEFGSTLSNYNAFKEMSLSFNKMAQELENTEVLRGDFINNFSHEFKTPIVSIAGLAKLLNKGNLTEEQKKQYLRSIEEESMRLSYMATNVLALTKVENQTILTDISMYNLSEQIRSAFLLLEEKWIDKDIEFQIDLDEFFIEANEELLKQVWINLIDNAVKFVSPAGSIKFNICESNNLLFATISNTSEDIPAEKLGRLFNKFYQADESHATEGNGIGLAIVKKIVTLHKGEIFVKSENGVTTFTVELPKKQK